MREHSSLIQNNVPVFLRGTNIRLYRFPSISETVNILRGVDGARFDFQPETQGLNPRRSVKVPALLLVAAASLHFASYDITRQPVTTDVAFFLYFAGRTAAGSLPYLDFVDFKTPLAVFAGALGHLAGGLYAVRIEYLFFAALSAAAAGLVHLHLFNRRQGAAWIGLLAFCGFNLLGLMPSIGNMPKQLTLLCAALGLLAANRGKWLIAGLLTLLAFMDWQPGGALACAALLVTALLGPGRGRALLRSLAGMIMGAAAFFLFFLANGGLAAFVRLAFLAPFVRPAAEGGAGLLGRLERIWRLLEADCRKEMWIVYAAFAGFLLYPFILVRLKRRRACTFPFGVGCAFYHYGIVLWTLYDFQGHGDLYIALGSLAFFGALPLIAIYYTIQGALLRYLQHRRRRRTYRILKPALFTAALVVMAVLARPSLMKDGWRIGEPKGPAACTLSEQREVSGMIQRAFADGRLAFLDYSEVLYLAEMKDALGFVYFDPVIFHSVKEEGESKADTLIRHLDRAAPDGIVVPQRSRVRHWPKSRMTKWLKSRGYRPRRFTSNEGGYSVVVWSVR